MKKLLLFSLFALLASAMGWAATETWTKVTSTPDSWDGDYLIVYEKGNLAFNGSANPISEQDQKNVPVTISGNSITTNACNFFFTIKETTTSGQYTITSNSGLCIGHTGKKNSLSTGSKLTNTLSIDGSGNVVIKSCQTTNYTIKYNTQDPRFCYYKSGQQPIALYKKQEAPATQVAALEIKPGFGTIEVGTEITISCATKGAVLNGTIGTETLEGAALPYTYTASELGALKVEVYASKEGLEDSEVLDDKFIVKAAVPVAYRDVITADDYDNVGSYKPLKTLEKGGAKYEVTAIVTNDYIQFNKGNNAGLVMTTAQAAASKLIITWNKSGKGSFEIYGKNTPYSAVADLNNNAGELIKTVSYSADGPTTVDLGGNYTFIGIKPIDGASYVTSFEFIWNEGAAGGADVTYTKASEAKAGNFAVLATADGKAVGRNADLSPVKVTVSGDAIGLNKSQPDVDEFEIIEKDATNKIYNLKGGLESDNSRCFLTYDGTGVTTVAEADANAGVTFESTAAGLLVKFNDGQYLMFNGTKFIKADYGEAVVQAEGETLTPVIVFMSSSNVSTGVETVEFDENAEAQYFNLNGVQVKAENLTPGLYIVRQGNKVSKQVIR